MPLYEGIGLIGEKQQHPVILDIGSAFTKCGFGGELGPRANICTEVDVDGRTRNITEYSDSADLYNIVLNLLHNIYFRHLLVNPKNHSVVIVESLLSPSEFRNTLARVLFRHFEVPSCLFVPSHLVALLTLGTQTGLVMDVGHRETVVIPVYEGVALLKYWQALPLASEALSSCIMDLIRDKATVLGAGDAPLPVVGRKVLQDIQVKTCFVAGLDRADALAAGKPLPEPAGFCYPLPSGVTLSVPGIVRQLPAEVLFTPDADNLTLPTIILNTLVQCPVDLRRCLAEQLLVIGGMAQLPGLLPRLLAELRRLVQLPPYSHQLSIDSFRLHAPPAKPNFVAWLGGSLFGDSDVILTRSLTREKYLESGNKLPDWCSIAPPAPSQPIRTL